MGIKSCVCVFAIGKITIVSNALIAFLRRTHDIHFVHRQHVKWAWKHRHIFFSIAFVFVVIFVSPFGCFYAVKVREMSRHLMVIMSRELSVLRPRKKKKNGFKELYGFRRFSTSKRYRATSSSENWNEHK